MIRTPLDDGTRDELRSLRRTDPPARVRDRLEMVLLSDAGWSPPRIAAHLGYCAATVRAVLKDFLARGAEALHPRRTGPPPDADRRRKVTEALTALLGQDRTWTGRQLALALEDRGVALSPRQVRRYLAGMRAGWRRTADSVRHKQDPAKVARARKVLDGLKKKPRTAA
jgi:putative transposase